ncbi:MAG: hypothetical protein QOD77_1547 [Thermoplasmata archaeon]|nr:hypothetical protein [Thermoplasmata archaeon]
MPRVVVLANCGSGFGALPPDRVRAIEAAFRPTGVLPQVRCVVGAGLEVAARAALAERPDAVVAAGGDGTVNAVASALAGTDTPMAVLPLGTLNHFARDAKVPKDLEAAAAIAAAGQPRPVDVARVNGRVFVNNASIGVYPRAVVERDQRRVPGHSKRLAMARAAWAVLRRMPAHRLVMSVDGRPVQRTTSFVMVGNNAYETSFGRLGHRASLTGGRLGVYHVARPGRAAILGLGVRAALGRLDAARDFRAEEARTVVLQSPRALVRVALDGEVVRLRPPLAFESWPGALRLLGPEAA